MLILFLLRFKFFFFLSLSPFFFLFCPSPANFLASVEFRKCREVEEHFQYTEPHLLYSIASIIIIIEAKEGLILSSPSPHNKCQNVQIVQHRNNLLYASCM